MRWSWLRAALFGFVIGPTPVAAEPVDMDVADREPAETETADEEPTVLEAEVVAPRSGGQELGHRVRGAHYTVWDEDARAALEWASELAPPGDAAVATARWRALAASAAARPPLLSNDPALEFAPRRRASGGGAGLSPLGLVLCLLPSLDRTCLVSAWATSPDEPTRAALARALAAPFDAVGVPGALEYLSADRSPQVRLLARAAAAARSVPGTSPGLNVPPT